MGYLFNKFDWPELRWHVWGHRHLSGPRFTGRTVNTGRNYRVDNKSRNMQVYRLGVHIMYAQVCTRVHVTSVRNARLDEKVRKQATVSFSNREQRQTRTVSGAVLSESDGCFKKKHCTLPKYTRESEAAGQRTTRSVCRDQASRTGANDVKLGERS